MGSRLLKHHIRRIWLAGDVMEVTKTVEINKERLKLQGGNDFLVNRDR